ncbi:MAG: hypothetical protein OXG35_09560 [Acidobacteria bacterium]|nr:hypothetical protein [Acidobacteriota bacterium]
MPLTGAERQKRWRERHPARAAEHLKALQSRKRPREECKHDDVRFICRSPIHVLVCHDCGFIHCFPRDLADYCAKHSIPLRGRSD